MFAASVNCIYLPWPRNLGQCEVDCDHHGDDTKLPAAKQIIASSNLFQTFHRENYLKSLISDYTGYFMTCVLIKRPNIASNSLNNQQILKGMKAYQRFQLMYVSTFDRMICQEIPHYLFLPGFCGKDRLYCNL